MVSLERGDSSSICPARFTRMGSTPRATRPASPCEVAMHQSPRARLAAYGVAVLATGVSLLVRWPLWPVIGDDIPFMTCFPAVIVVAFFGGLGPGLVATLGSGAAAAFFLLKPHYSFEVHDPVDALSLGLFTLTGVVLSVLSGSRLEGIEKTRRLLEGLAENIEALASASEELTSV